MFSYIGTHLCELNTNPANKVAHVMRLTYARACACSTDYMNKLEYVCLCWRLTGKNTNSLKCSIYITPEKTHLMKVISNNVLSQVLV